MGKIAIVVEGRTDELILKAVLPKDIQRKIQFIVGSGRYSAQSIARTILAYDRQPVALILDADTTDESKIKEQITYFQKALGEVATDVPYQAFIIVPQIEVLLFESKSYLEKIAERPISQEEWAYAQTAPKKALERFLGDNISSQLPHILKLMNETTVKKLRQHSSLKSLIIFLQSASAALEQEAIAA